MRVAGLFFMTVAAGFAQQASSLALKNGSPFLSIPSVPEGLRFDTSLPAFEARDIAGRTWRMEDLRGKLTLVYVWHTLEARAVDAHDASVRHLISGLSDLPAVQRFYDQVKDTKNIQVLTLCRDFDYTHAPDYVKEKKYSFPVIADWVLIEKVFPNPSGSSAYWVIDRDARLSSPIRSWSLGRVLYEIERAATR